MVLKGLALRLKAVFSAKLVSPIYLGESQQLSPASTHAQ
jgi:hypothetical protein